MCDMLRGSLLFTARAWAVRIVFLICCFALASNSRRQRNEIGRGWEEKEQGKKRAYLATIKVVSAQIRQILLRKRHRLHPLKHPNSLNKHLKHALLGLGAQFPIT